jgi:SNF2 family DNA or RNA helicase
MIIKKAAIEEFLKHPRDDWRSWKDLSLEELESLREELPKNPPIWKKLLRHQKICFLLGVKLSRFAFHLGVGCGKTLVAIALAKYFYKAGTVNCVLVLVPNRSNLTEWADEIEKHSPSTKYVVLAGSTTDKWREFESNQDTLIFVTTYSGLYRMTCAASPVSRNGKTRSKFKPNPKLIARLARVDALVLDESTLVSNKLSLFWRIAKKLSQQCHMVLTLTGTAFGRDPTLLWSQLNIVDNGASLGPTMGLYRAAFFNATPNFWGGVDYKFKPSMTMALNRCLAHRSISIQPNPEDLPRVTRIIKKVNLPGEAGSYYSRARKLLIDAGQDPRKVQEAFVRMRQISSGFLGYKDDLTRGEVFFDPNPKLELLISIIQTIDLMEHRVIIFHDFIPTGTMISNELSKLKIPFVRIAGGMRDPEGVLHSFKSGKVPVLVMSNSAGSFGLNLQVADYGIVVESPVSVIIRQQIEARFIRQFSTWSNVFLYDLACKGTVDEVILEWARSGKDLLRAIVHGEIKL